VCGASPRQGILSLQSAIFKESTIPKKIPRYNLFYPIMKILLENFIFGAKLAPVFL
jgi:hypothetical protein